MINCADFNNSRSYNFSEYPNKCPHCHLVIEPIPLRYREVESSVEFFLFCPNVKCQKGFIAYYIVNPNGAYQFINKVTFGSAIVVEFSDTIKAISEKFVNIFNQASFAEQHSLDEICGVGFRKSLEFLIKDYLIKKNPEKAEIIKDTFLGKCIKDMVDDSKIKKVAERAVWLGNDETHYIRIWNDKDIDDLKKLINLTVHWIEMEELTNSIISEMP